MHFCLIKADYYNLSMIGVNSILYKNRCFQALAMSWSAPLSRPSCDLVILSLFCQSISFFI